MLFSTATSHPHEEEKKEAPMPKYGTVFNIYFVINAAFINQSFYLATISIKIKLYYTRGVTPKRVTSGGTHLRGFVPEQHSSEQTSKKWRADGDTGSDRIGSGVEPQTSRADSYYVFDHYIDRPTESN